MLTTKLSCPCGQTIDLGNALPRGSVECPACLRLVPVPQPPPGIAASWRPAPVVEDDDEPTYELPPEPPFPTFVDDDEEAGEIAAGLNPAAPPPPSEYVARNAVASNPARARVEWFRYYRAFPAQLSIAAVVASLGGLGFVLYHPAFVSVVVVGLFILVTDVIKTRRKFLVGDVCPAVVLSESPPLVAVRTDLATGGSLPRPAIKVLHQPIRNLPAGTRLAAVAVYQPPVMNGAWFDFDPQILRCVTADEVDGQRVIDSIGAQDWQVLDEALAKGPSPKPGLHTLWDDDVQGRRTNRQRRVAEAFSLVGFLIVATLLAKYGKPPKPVVPPDSVPGRVHTDWGR